MSKKDQRTKLGERSRSGPEIAHASMAVSTLMTTADDALADFRSRRLTDPTVELENLARARDILDAIGEALVGRATRPEPWLRIEAAWHALFEPGPATTQPAAQQAGVSPPPPAGSVPPSPTLPSTPPAARDELPAHARAALDALEKLESRQSTQPAGSMTLPLDPSGLGSTITAPKDGQRPPTLPFKAPQAAQAMAANPDPAGRPSPSLVAKMVGATTEVDVAKQLDSSARPAVEAARHASKKGGAHSHRPASSGGAPRASDPPPRPSFPPPSAIAEPPPSLPEHLVGLSVEQFATYCAHCAASPDKLAQIALRYGMSNEEERLLVERHWHAKLYEDPALRDAWREHLSRAQKFVKRR